MSPKNMRWLCNDEETVNLRNSWMLWRGTSSILKCFVVILLFFLPSHSVHALSESSQSYNTLPLIQPLFNEINFQQRGITANESGVSLEGQRSRNILKQRIDFDILEHAVPVPSIISMTYKNSNKQRHSVLTGIINIDNEPYLQLLEGDRYPSIIKLSDFKSKFLNQEYLEVSFCDNTSSGFDLPVGKGKVRINKDYHSFGYLSYKSREEELACSFELYNAGETPLQILKAEGSCACTSIKYDPADGYIHSGEQLRLSVKRHAAGPQESSFRDQVIVEIKDVLSNQIESIVFELLGNHDSDTVFAVPSVINFGSLEYGDIKTGLVRVSENEREKFQIVSVKTNNPAITTRVETSIHNNGLDYLIHTTLDTGKIQSEGEIKDSLIIVTDHPRYSELKVLFEAEILPLIRCVPSKVAFGYIAQGKMYRSNVRIISNKCESFSLGRIVKPDEVDIVQRVANNGDLDLEITIELDSSGVFDEKITFYIKHPEGESSIILPLIAIVK
ncbi:MAG: DUF1573 domain-containing protein [Candidatus Scalindua sp.]